MEKTDCFGLEWLPSVDGAPSIEAKTQIATLNRFVAVKTCLLKCFFWMLIEQELKHHMGLFLFPIWNLRLVKNGNCEREKFLFSQNHQENAVERKARIV